MTRVHLSERQFRATLLPALRYRDALCVLNPQLRERAMVEHASNTIAATPSSGSWLNMRYAVQRVIGAGTI